MLDEATCSGICGDVETRRAAMQTDQKTLELLRRLPDEIWTELDPVRQARLSKAALAERMLLAVLNGERDPSQLRARALSCQFSGL